MPSLRLRAINAWPGDDVFNCSNLPGVSKIAERCQVIILLGCLQQRSEVDEEMLALTSQSVSRIMAVEVRQLM